LTNLQLQKNKNPRSDELETFFYPLSIAVIGASQNPLKPNGIPLYLLSMFGYRGDIFPVNPKYDRVGGLKCYPNINDIEETVDLAIVGVAAAQVMEVLEDCARKKVKSVIVFTSGFAEVSEEGRAEQKQMRRLAEENGMRILGPNCLGILNYYNGCMASFFYNQERSDLAHPEVLSFITQSGGLGGIIYQMIMQLSIGFNYFVSTGNEADVSFAEILNYLVNREEVSIVAGYLEGLQGDGCLFVNACKKALEEQKLVAMLKVGRTDSGAAAAASHTGALVGQDHVYEGVFRQCGVVRADDVEQMNALVALYATGRLPAGKKMAVITISGGGGVVVADKCPEYQLEVVNLTEATQEKLREFFPVFGAVKNPVDLTSQLFVDTTLFQKALRLVMQDPNIDVGGFFYNLEMPDPEAVAKIIEVYKEVDKPLIIFTWPTGQDYAIDAKKALIQAGVPVIEHIPSGLWAISALADWVKKTLIKKEYPVFKSDLAKEQAFAILSDHQESPGKALAEWRSKKILSAYGIPVTEEILARSEEEALAAAGNIGFPVALKIMSADLLHKTDIGGVRLNINSTEEVKREYHKLLSTAKQNSPNAKIDGILVQEMIEPGLEVIIGIKKDPVFGTVIVLGLGGIHVEILKDVSIRILPLSEEDARNMLEELKGSALFKGVRGSLPRDSKALVDTLLKVARMASELEEDFFEIDVNPLMVRANGRGVVAVDALIVTADSETL
jgi:acetate---CoA ligase (ADP-forming)